MGIRGQEDMVSENGSSGTGDKVTGRKDTVYVEALCAEKDNNT